jgi:hypothetical protein
MADDRSCRLTGAATFTGVGIYALRQAQLQGTFQRVRPKGGSVVGGQVTAVIGIGQLIHLSILSFGGYRDRVGLMDSMYIARIGQAGHVGSVDMESRIKIRSGCEGQGRGLGWNRRQIFTRM